MQKSTADMDAVDTVPGTRRRLAFVLGGIALVALVAVAGFLAWNRFVDVPPVVTAFTSAHGLEQEQVVGETRVFDLEDEVSLIFTLAQGSAGHSVMVQVADEPDMDAAVDLAYEMRDADEGPRAVTYTPPAEGVYTATLYLDREPVQNAQLTFKVVEGGPQLQAVASALAVDPETFEAETIASRFHPQDTIFITYRVVNVVPDDTVSIRYAIDGTMQPSDPFDTVVFEEEGDFRGHFSLQGSSDRPLSIGDYRAELFYNDDLVSVVYFTVEL